MELRVRAERGKLALRLDEGEGEREVVGWCADGRASVCARSDHVVIVWVSFFIGGGETRNHRRLVCVQNEEGRRLESGLLAVAPPRGLLRSGARIRTHVHAPLLCRTHQLLDRVTRVDVKSAPTTVHPCRAWNQDPVGLPQSTATRSGGTRGACLCKLHRPQPDRGGSHVEARMHRGCLVRCDRICCFVCLLFHGDVFDSCVTCQPRVALSPSPHTSRSLRSAGLRAHPFTAAFSAEDSDGVATRRQHAATRIQTSQQRKQNE